MMDKKFDWKKLLQAELLRFSKEFEQQLTDGLKQLEQEGTNGLKQLKQQLKDELKAEILAELSTEGVAAADELGTPSAPLTLEGKYLYLNINNNFYIGKCLCWLPPLEDLLLVQLLPSGICKWFNLQHIISIEVLIDEKVKQRWGALLNEQEQQD